MQSPHEKIDEAIREWLQLDDEQFETFQRHREFFINELQNRQKALIGDKVIEKRIKKLRKDLKAKKSNKTTDKRQLLEFNITLKVMGSADSNGFDALKPSELAKLIGAEPRTIRNLRNKALRAIRESDFFSEDGELEGWDRGSN